MQPWWAWETYFDNITKIVLSSYCVFCSLLWIIKTKCFPAFNDVCWLSVSLSGLEANPPIQWDPVAIERTNGNRPAAHVLLTGECQQHSIITSVSPQTDALKPLCVLAVSTLPETRRQQAADHAAEEEEVQEQDHPGLQDAGARPHQHGRGEGWQSSDTSRSDSGSPDPFRFRDSWSDPGSYRILGVPIRFWESWSDSGSPDPILGVTIRFWESRSDPGSPDPILGVPIRFWESRSDSGSQDPILGVPIRFWESRSDPILWIPIRFWEYVCKGHDPIWVTVRFDSGSHDPIRFWESRSDSILGVTFRSDSGSHGPILLVTIRSDSVNPDSILGVCMQESRSDLSHGPIRFWESQSDSIRFWESRSDLILWIPIRFWEYVCKSHDPIWVTIRSDSGSPDPFRFRDSWSDPGSYRILGVTVRFLS